MADVSVTINPAATISATIGDGASNVVTGVSVEGSSNKTLTIYRQGADPISTSFTDLQNSGEASVQNVVYATGDQTISGAKDFVTRPTVNGVGVLLSGEAAAAETGYLTGYVSKTETGDFLTNSDTGNFYTNDNPSGYITGVDLSNYVTGDVVRPSETGNYSNIFYPLLENPSEYATTSELTGVSGFLQEDLDNKQVAILNLNSRVSTLESTSATTGYVTGASGYLQGQINNIESQTGNFVTGDVVRPDATGSFLVASDLNPYQTVAGSTGISGYLQGQISAIDLSPLNDATGNLDGRVNTLESQTGSFVTGNIVRPDATGDFLTSNDLSPYQTIVGSTGISGYLQGQINNIDLSSLNTATGNLDSRTTALESQMGDFLTGETDPIFSSSIAFSIDDVLTGQWGTGYNDSITGVSVAGSGTKTLILYQRDGSTLETNFSDLQGTGDGGANYYLTGADFNTSNGDLTLYVNDGSTVTQSLDGRYVTGLVVRQDETGNFLVASDLSAYQTIEGSTGISGYLQGQIDVIDLTSLESATGNLNTRVQTIEGITGDFALSSNTGAFLTTGAANGLYYPLSSNPSSYLVAADIADLATTGYITGISGYLQSQINGVDLTPLETATGVLETRVSSLEDVSGLFVLSSQTGNFITTGTSGYLQTQITANYNNLITGVDVQGSSSKTITLYQQDGGTLTANFTDLEGTGDGGSNYYLTGADFNFSNGDLTLYVNDGSIVVQSLDGRYVTGNVVRPDETGNFLVAADLGDYQTIEVSTGISGYLQSQINGIDLTALENATGNLDSRVQALENETGNYLVVSDLAPYQTVENSTGISGYLQAQISDNSSAISSINSSSGEFLTTGAGDVRYYPLSTNPSNYLVAADISDLTNTEYVTGISGYLQGKINIIDLSALETATGNLDTRLTSVENGTGDFITTGTSGYLQSQITSNTNDSITGIDVAGTDTKTITLYQNDGGTLTANFTDLQSSGAASSVSYEEIYIDAGAMTTGISGASPTGIYLGGSDISFDSYSFGAGANSYAQFKFTLPSNWHTGDMRAKFHWTADNGATGHVLWGIQSRAASDDDAISGSWGTIQEVLDQFITGYDKHLTSATSAIEPSNTPIQGDSLYFRVKRNADDASDTFALSSYLNGVSIQYKISGSIGQW